MPGTNPPKTLLLTAPDPSLVKGVMAMRPDLRLVPIGTEIGAVAAADDYMTGPLDPHKLVERLARYEAGATAEPAPRASLRNGDLAIDLAAHQLRYRGVPVPLRPNEFRLLVHFMEHPDQVFSRTALIERLGKGAEALDERTVDVWIGRVRRTLAAHGAPDPFRTVRTLGYVMDSTSA